MTRRIVSPLWLIGGASLWMALLGNGAFWRRLADLGLLADAKGWAFALAMLVMIWSVLAMVLGMFAWRPSLKPAITVLVAATALASHFMLRYHVVIDAGMLVNVMQTDAHEARALADLGLAGSLLLLAGLPLWFLWRQPVAHGPARRQVTRSAAVVLFAFATLAVTLVASFQMLASVTRNHKDVRYLINPLSSLYAIGRVAAQPWRLDSSKLLPIAEDARLIPATQGRQRPRLLLLVLGETARSDHFGLNGYARDTTPSLSKEGVVSFRDAWSCGTSTAASVPCMFSHLTREQFDARKAQFEGLMDVLQQAGLAVLWLDNQSGCKGVCDRIPHADAATEARARRCPGGECLDGVMLEGLDERIAALDPQRRARGIVVVMHQMGSHGPAYHLRSPAGQKRFLPECASAALQECGRESVVNAYDNSILYTDHFLAEAIGWLKRREAGADAAMVYVSDHGESLGENNLYLHGLPYAIAPDVQKHVPWVTWLSPGYEGASGISLDCLRGQRDARVSHDNYFHSVLGLMDVHTSAYSPAMDAYADCRRLSMAGR